MGRSLFDPLVELSGKILSKTADFLTRPYVAVNDKFWDLDNAKLYCCGFSIILVPVVVAFWSIVLGILLVQLLVHLALGLVLALFFVSIGVWPALVTSVGITGMAISRLPWMVYSHCLVTYRTVMLRANVKLISFLILPLFHLLIPPAIFLGSLLVHLTWFASISFVGYPFKPWQKIPDVLKKFWKKYVTDIERLFDNFGHPSGIPQDWDGRVYGLPVDPIKIITNFCLYLIALLPISLVTFVIFAIKAVPIYLGTLVEFWKTLNIGAALAWYKKVLVGSQPATLTSAIPAQVQRSGHDSWTKPLKKATKGAKKFIENYANIQILTVYSEILKRHWKRIYKLDPHKLTKIARAYMDDFSPLKLIPEQAGIAWIVLWLPLTLTSILWLLGLALVLTIPPTTFLLGFLLWTASWIPVIILPPLLYVLGWVFIIFGLPSLYLLLWVIVLVGPWVFVVIGMVSGPVLSLKIFFTGLSKNFFNPVEMWSGIKLGLRQIPQTLIKVDKVTGSLSLGKIRLFKAEHDFELENIERVEINYWDLYITQCKDEAQRIQDDNWLSQEDIQAASATAMIAIPGNTIISILEKSIRKKQKRSHAHPVERSNSMPRLHTKFE